jgi:GT2 family glycosyltransferase
VDSGGSVAELDLPLKVDHHHGYANDYQRWIRDFEKRDPAQIELDLRTFAHRPLVSILVPVYRTRGVILEKTIRSVLNQSYPDWELCVVDDGSQSAEVDWILDRHAASDGRIKVVHLQENRGISGATNAALAVATGELVALLDHDDELAQDALFHIVAALNRRPDADVFYSDEDHIDDEGSRSDPFFKPDWSPDLILGENYICHFLVLRSGLCRELGGFRSETDLSQDLDIVLRASLRTQAIVHVPKVLYHWRTEVSTGGRASDSHGQRAIETSRRAVEDYLKAIGSEATVMPGAVPSRWRVRYPIPKQQSVRILVPCGGKLPLLKRCLAGLAEKTDFRAFEVSVIDNSQGTEIADFVAGWSVSGRPATYVDCRNQPFSFSAFNNYAARNIREPLLLFLNDDISMIHGEWLTAMVELASRPEVGAVGAKLLYPDNTIQHAGVVLGIFDAAGHGFRGAFAEDRTYFDFPDLIRNVSAVTGACLMVPTDKFRECGGFDEEAFPVAYNDVDLCLRLGQKGYRTLYTPHAQLYHHEAASKRAADKDPRPAETALFKARWKGVIEHDPFYSPNLAIDAEDYSYRKAE